MTTNRTPTGFRDTILTGIPAQVANVLTTHTNAGTLIRMGAPRLAPTGDRVSVAVRLADTQPVTHPVASARAASVAGHITATRRISRRTARRTRPALTAAVVLAITTAVVGIVFAVAYAVGALVAFIADHAAIIAGGLAVAAILSYLATVGGRTGKRHCPGC